MTSLPLRQAARVVLLDREQRVLLLRYDENGGFWATTGGSLEPGEDYRTAARREVLEELGIADVALGPVLADRDQQHHVGGHLVRQVERYYLARVDADAVDPAAATQADQIRERRWWTTAELHSTTETVYPLGLADLLTGLAHGAPVRPVVLTG
ncbi:NUDIX hydrolase [Streptomyces sp. NPDC091209]|uniref:NUDIX hydrolase n=1 Tax=Streptomyces sp. NPDC091209 TaxID=3365974 RepID=UPI0037FFBAE0